MAYTEGWQSVPLSLKDGADGTKAATVSAAPTGFISQNSAVSPSPVYVTFNIDILISPDDIFRHLQIVKGDLP